MRRAISAYVVQCGQKINDDPSIPPLFFNLLFVETGQFNIYLLFVLPPAASADAVPWVQQVIELKAKFDSILEKSFEKDKSFQTTINDVIFPPACSPFSFFSTRYQPPTVL